MSRCLHCGKLELCAPCADGNPPYDRRDYEKPETVKPDREELETLLAELPKVFALLPLFVETSTAPPDPDHRIGDSNPARPPMRLEVLDLLDMREKADAEAQRTDYDLDRRAGSRRQGVLPTLVGWARLVDGELADDEDLPEYKQADEHGLIACSAVCTEAPNRARKLKTYGPCSEVAKHHWSTPTVTGECAWLSAQLGWIIEQDWADEFENDVSNMVTDVKRVTGTDTKVKMTCLVVGCGWPVVKMDGGSWYRCTGCGKPTSRMELHRMAERAKPKPLRTLAKQLNRSERSLRAYRTEGLIRPVARDGAVDLYDQQAVTEVIKVKESNEMSTWYRKAV